MEDKFGEECLRILFPSSLGEFDNDDCLRIALRLRLPVKSRESLRVPVNIVADNPVTGSPLHALRILTVRDQLEGGETEPFTPDDDPFDEELGVPYFGLYGVGLDGIREHIVDRRTYAAVAEFALKLWPGIQLPVTLISD